MTDADTGNSDTEVWLDFSLACEYIPQTEYDELHADAEEIGRLISFMIEHPYKFLPKSDKSTQP
jgi:hypothetical protein